MLRIFFILLAFIGCYIWGDLKKWDKYYSTILYAIIGDLAYNCLFCGFDLWLYDGFINHTISDILFCFTVFPCVINIYLSHYPKKLHRMVAYIFIWSLACSIIEYTALLLDGFSYGHGWTIFWSFGLYIGAFMLIRLHYINNIVVWPLSGACALAVMVLFKLPLECIK